MTCAHHPLLSFVSEEVIVAIRRSATIFEACKEGVALARAVARPVVFEFNEALAVCHADSDPVEVAKRLVAEGVWYQ